MGNRTISNAFSATGGAAAEISSVAGSSLPQFGNIGTSGRSMRNSVVGPASAWNCARRFRTSHRRDPYNGIRPPCHTTAPCQTVSTPSVRSFRSSKVAIECPVGDKLKELLAAAAALEGRACDDSLYMRAEGPGVWARQAPWRIAAVCSV